mgnify:FL=1
MLINVYESRNPVAIKRALRLEQILEQRIAQLPNYLRPQCALVLPPEEVNNSHNKIRISKGEEVRVRNQFKGVIFLVKIYNFYVFRRWIRIVTVGKNRETEI